MMMMLLNTLQTLPEELALDCGTLVCAGSPCLRLEIQEYIQACVALVDSADLENMTNTFFHSTEGKVFICVGIVLGAMMVMWLLVSIIHKVKTWPKSGKPMSYRDSL